MEINLNTFQCQRSEGHGDVYSWIVLSVYWVPSTTHGREMCKV